MIAALLVISTRCAIWKAALTIRISSEIKQNRPNIYHKSVSSYNLSSVLFSLLFKTNWVDVDRELTNTLDGLGYSM